MTTFLNNLFTYDEQNPMIFSSWQFWLFFTVLIGGYCIVYRGIRLRNIYLMAFSIFFYYKIGGAFTFLLLFSTFSDYYLAGLIHQQKTKRRKKIFLITSVILNLSFLAYFKYTYFFTDIFNQVFGTNFIVKDILAIGLNSFTGMHFDITSIILPVGISFYTFQSLSYTIDIYREEIEPVKNIFDYTFFVTFFPQLVAGPIVRASEFIPQLYKKFELSKQEFGAAIFLIAGGLVKKLLVSDYISVNFVDRVFDTPLNYSGFENLLAVYGYAIQIYCDFSGYTDIAIGLAQLLGFRLNLNFASPYTAKNITEFWHKWHISLSTWLKDYLYVSLGGNRKGKVRTYINLFITMVLGGLWHGAALRFMIWGALHGAALAVHKVWLSIFPKTKKESITATIIFTLLTFHFVCFCWIFFRADNMQTVSDMLNQMAFNFQMNGIPQVITAYKNIVVVIVLGYLLHYIPKQVKEYATGLFSNLSPTSIATIMVVLVFVLYQFHTAQIQPFIYFQF
jgi:alginate O-acetyltransferase complex protein AlgI